MMEMGHHQQACRPVVSEALGLGLWVYISSSLLALSWGLRLENHCYQMKKGQENRVGLFVEGMRTTYLQAVG